MLCKALEDANGERINKELYSARLHLSMSAYCEANNLPDFAHRMPVQAQHLE